MTDEENDVKLDVAGQAVFLDRVLPFQIEGLDVHGRMVRLDAVTTEVLCRHNYPESVAKLLGEALVLVSMLGSLLKFDGRFVMQTKTDGPVSMLVADYSSAGGIRGYAQFDADKLGELEDESFVSVMGTGYVAFTVDQGPDMDPYQGIVPVEGESLSDVALSYFDRSEQIPTFIRLSMAPLHKQGGQVDWRAAGIMVQQTARDGGEAVRGSVSDDDWRRIGMMLETATDAELLDSALSEQDLAYRLFHEDGVRSFEPRHLHFACSCSSERVETMLQSLPEADIEEMRQDDETVVTCEFCSTVYRFDSDLQYIDANTDANNEPTPQPIH